MIFKRRCPECAGSFYTDTEAPSTHCQSCTGTHDDAEQKRRDASLIEQASAAHVTAAPQSVDPRAGYDTSKRPRKRKAAQDAPEV